MNRCFVVLAGVLLGLAGYGFAAESESFKVTMLNADRKEVGEATLRETPNGVLIRVQLRQKPPGISAGTHAIHIHEVGKCEPPFKSAGGHFNPLGKKHGFLDKQGKHGGDLPNIHIPPNGSLTVEFLAPQLTLSSGKASLFDSDGSSLVIHAGADDYRTDPAGDSGDRIACGVIEKQSK
ncbi:MAG: superoxide dismutase family protein [Candidatus Binatia bacterium]